MDLTPTDVEQKAFTQALRGYQMDEVDDFLDEIVTSLRSYDQRLRDAQEKIRALETDAVGRGGDETTISRAILVAQRSADNLLAEAKVEADKIRQTAMAETEILSSERDMERNRLQSEIDGMRDRVSRLRETLATLASAVAGQVAGMEAEIADTATHLQPTAAEPAMPGDDGATISHLKLEDPTPATEDDASMPAEVEDHGSHSSTRPRRIDLSDRDDDFDKEEAVTRVSARPWERG
jgi:cell division initiation protein